MDKNKVALILGVVCIILTIAICVQVKTVEDAEKEVGRNTLSSNDGLRDEVLKIREKYNNEYKELEKAELDLEQLRAQAAANNTVDLQKQEQITIYGDYEAVSINNQRIVSTTGIMCDGNIVRINGEMVGVPITIKAIGLPNVLYYQLIRGGGYLERMKSDGVKVFVEQSDNITIPKFEGVYTHDYIK